MPYPRRFVQPALNYLKMRGIAMQGLQKTAEKCRGMQHAGTCRAEALRRGGDFWAACQTGCCAEHHGDAPPRHLAQRVWICLKMREIAFAQWRKSSEEYQNKGDRAWRGVRSGQWVERGTSGTPKRKRQRRFAGARRRKRKYQLTTGSISLSIEKCKCFVVKGMEMLGLACGRGRSGDRRSQGRVSGVWRIRISLVGRWGRRGRRLSRG